MPTKESILKSKYKINGTKINSTYNKSNLWTIKNALRELNQKRIKNCKIIMKMKNKCLIRKGLWKCPHCNSEVNRLTSAHIGIPVSRIIDDILIQYPNETDICVLDNIVKSKHNSVDIVICCDKCNSLVDDSF